MKYFELMEGSGALIFCMLTIDHHMMQALASNPFSILSPPSTMFIWQALPDVAVSLSFCA